MFYLCLKSLQFRKDSVSQVSQEHSLIYYKLNDHSISHLSRFTTDDILLMLFPQTYLDFEGSLWDSHHT